MLYGKGKLTIIDVYSINYVYQEAHQSTVLPAADWHRRDNQKVGQGHLLDEGLEVPKFQKLSQ